MVDCVGTIAGCRTAGAEEKDPRIGIRGRTLYFTILNCVIRGIVNESYG